MSTRTKDGSPIASLQRSGDKLVHMDQPGVHEKLLAYCKEQGLEMKSFMSGVIKGYIMGLQDGR